MIKRVLILIFISLLGLNARAHEGEHGPKVKNQGKYGGKMASVILKKDLDNSSATAIYIAELTLSADGTLRVYFYDKSLDFISINAKSIVGNISFKDKKTRKETHSKIDFVANGNGFEAKIPSSINRASSLEIDINTPENDYVAAFPRIK